MKHQLTVSFFHSTLGFRDGASVSRSKSLENTAGLLSGADKRLLAASSAKREHRNSSCGNLDYLISGGKESGHQLGEELKRKLNESVDEANCGANKSKQRIGNGSRQFSSFIRKKPKNSIRSKSVSQSTMTNDLRTVHLHVIEREFRNKLKDDRPQVDGRGLAVTSEENRENVNEADQAINDDRKRRQSAGEMLKYSLANQSKLAKRLNGNLFQSHEALTG